MDADVIARLSQVNRDFYATFADDFSNARKVSRTNLDAIMPYLAGRYKLLDVGCGNGRLAGKLDAAGVALTYTGIDLTPALLEIALTRASRLASVRAEFYRADLMQADWADEVVGRGPFDSITALAVLHHIPAASERLRILRRMHDLLAHAGVVILSNWQFARSARLRSKVVPWSEVGLRADDIEPGDALIDWKRGGHGYRYCHLLDEGEIEALASESGFGVQTQFGGDDELNLYSVLSAQ